MPDEQPLPEVVYHYTSMETLLKILDSGHIWATNINYLNDVLERKHCLARVRARLGSAEGKRAFGSIKEESGDIEERDEMVMLPFVASFSAERDNLPQWHSYCSHGNGVCIGFRTESLKNAFLISTKRSADKTINDVWVEFGAIRYLDPNDILTVDEMIRKALSESTKWEVANPELVGKVCSRDYIFWLEIENFAARTKHLSFAAEKEFRLVIGDPLGFLDSLHYRTSRSTLIPYVVVGLPDPKQFLPGVGHKTPRASLPENPQPYFIDNVTIGPTPHSELSKDALDSLFGQINRDIVVYSSEVPYRDW